MALVKCKECGDKVSNKAKSCPSCGAKPPKKTSFVTWGIILIISLVIYGGYQNKDGSYQVVKPILSEAKKLEIQKKVQKHAQKAFERETIYKSKRAVKELTNTHIQK